MVMELLHEPKQEWIVANLLVAMEFFFSIKFLYVYIHLSLIDSFTEVSRFGCLTRLDHLLKETNNKTWQFVLRNRGGTRRRKVKLQNFVIKQN